MTPAEFIAAAFDPPALAAPPDSVPPGTPCAQSGVSIEAGYPISVVYTSNSSDYADNFRFASGYVSVPVARAWKTRLTGNLLALPEQGYRPFVASASATPDRPTWRDLVQRLERGTPTLAVMTDEVQRRLWPRAAVSAVGPQWGVYLHNDSGSRLLWLDHARLLDCLAEVESVYAAGFSKYAIRDGLLSPSSQAAIRAVGLPAARRYEQGLRAWRGTSEFLVALFIAQKGAE